MTDSQDQLRRQRLNAHSGQRKIIDVARADGRTVLTDSETQVFRQLASTVADCDEAGLPLTR